MKFYLLTHQKEYKRSSNSGKVVIDVLGEQNVFKILWERKSPDKDLLETINRGKAVLLYKDSKTEADSDDFKNQSCKKIQDLSDIENFVILDGTWQEAGKMYNKSPYLQLMKSYSFPENIRSRYNIRRNQKSGGLCTAECVIELLKKKGETRKADKLHNAFLEFLNLMISRVVVLPGESSD